MKKPRIDAFDPNAKIPSLKSPLDNMPVIVKPMEQEKPSQALPTARPGDDATGRPPDRAATRGGLIRRGFDWYADQLAALKKFSLEEQIHGRPGSMSEMVRDALDDYLKKRSSQ